MGGSTSQLNCCFCPGRVGLRLESSCILAALIEVDCQKNPDRGHNEQNLVGERRFRNGFLTPVGRNKEGD